MPEIVIFIIIKTVLAIAVFTGVMLLVPAMIWIERKVIADIQNRIGPNRVGPLGLLQPIADAVKLIMKEDIIPARADKFLYFIAPALSFMPSLIVASVIPFGPVVRVFGRDVQLMVAGSYRYGNFFVPEVSVGILFLLAITSLGVYGIVLGGWASANKWGLLGSLRSAAQMISYELPLTIALTGPLLLTGSLKMSDIVTSQINSLWFFLPQLLMLLVYFTSGVAETNRAPFDLPEAEQELIAGYHVEYSSFRFAMFFMGEYAAMVIVSAVAATVFLGGWNGPFSNIPWLGPVWLLIKILAILYLYVWMRGTWPRVRYDQLMALSWKVNIPIAVVNLLITSLVIALYPQAVGRLGPSMTAAIVLTVVNLILASVAFAFMSRVLKGTSTLRALRAAGKAEKAGFEVLRGGQQE